MNEPNCLVRTGSDPLQSAKLLLELVIIQLEKVFNEMKSGEMKGIGPGFEEIVRPWALVFIKNIKPYKLALAQEVIKIYQGLPDARPELRVWFDSIQVCRIETTHELEGILSILHVKEFDTPEEISSNSPTLVAEEEQESLLDGTTVIEDQQELETISAAAHQLDMKSNNNILSWMMNEKDNQPPCLIVVDDIFDLIITTHTQNRYNIVHSDPLYYLHLPMNGLGQVFAKLVETCEYERSACTTNWENTLGMKMNHSSRLLLTDHGILPATLPSPETHQGAHLRKIYKILHYYMDRVV